MTQSPLDIRLAELAPGRDPVDVARLAAAHASVVAAMNDLEHAEDRASAGVPGNAPVAPLAAERHRRAPARRLGAVAACLALGLGLVLWPSGGSDVPAFGNWDPVPEPVAFADVAHLMAECTDQVELVGQDEPLRPVILERRGDWLFGLFAQGTVGRENVAECLIREKGGTGDFVDVSWGSIEGTVDNPGPERATWESGHSSGTWTGAWGYAGTRVARVTLTVPSGRGQARTVEATLANGYYFAWWPGPTQRTPFEFTMTWYLDDGSVGGTIDVPA